MSEKSKQIDSFLKKNLNSYIDETIELCKHASISAQGGPVMRECANTVARTLLRHGFETQTFETPGNPVVVGTAKGKSDRTLLFYNHYDVQPADPLDLWTTPPFEPTVRDGILYARGSKDDKGEFVARIAAVDAAREANGGTLPCGVTFVVEGEEESGSPYIAQFVLDHLDLLKSHGAIWEEGGIDHKGHPVNLLGARGVLKVELVAETMSMDAHSGSAHNLPNAAWRLIESLTTLRSPDGKILIRGFYDDAKPPSELDLKYIDEATQTEPWLREKYKVRQFVGGLTGKDIERAVFNPTCNIQGIISGYTGEGSKTVIPCRASVKIDFRLVPDQDPDDIFEKLCAHLREKGFDDVIANKGRGRMWPYKASPDNPFVELTRHTAEEVYQKQALIRPMNGGSSPVYAFAKPLGGIPVVRAGVGYANSRTNAPDENVRLIDFENAARHIARIVEGFGELGG